MKVDLSKRGAITKLCRERRRASSFYAARQAVQSNWGIAGNTFRAFQGFGVSPSQVYREWAHKRGLSIIRNSPRRYSQESFEILHGKLARSLDRFWTQKANRALTISEKFKIVDLFVKVVARSNEVCQSVRRFLLQYGHIPLDKYSLLLVRQMFYGIVVCPKPRMGHIEDGRTYQFIQSQIYRLTSRAKVPNLYFDFMAWDMNH